ncbi:DMT family transporter [Alphaproteobacteria bacterium LSUCC0684]
MMVPRYWDVPILLILSLIWASSFGAIKIAVPEVGPAYIVAARCLIGGFLMLTVSLMVRRATWPRGIKAWLWLAMTGVISTATPFYLIAFAEQQISSGMTAILMTIGPIISIILAHAATEDEKITRSKVVGIGFGFLATIYLLRGGMTGFDAVEIVYPLAAMGAACCYAIGGLMAKRMVNVSAEVIAAVVLLSSGTFVLPFVLQDQVPAFTSLPLDVMTALLWLGLFPSGLAFYLRYFLIKRAGYSFVSYVGYLIPVFAVLIGLVLLDEMISLDTILAMAVILFGLMLTRSDREVSTLLKRMRY